MATSTARALSVTIPAEGVKFRLKALISGHVLYSRSEYEPLVGHYSGLDYDEQIFTLVYGKDGNAGKYAIKSWHCGKLIFSRTTQEPYVGNIYGDGIHDVNCWFEFPVDATFRNSFRIHCPASNTFLFSHPNLDPQFGNNTGDEYEDQLWYFERVED